MTVFWKSIFDVFQTKKSSFIFPVRGIKGKAAKNDLIPPNWNNRANHSIVFQVHIL